jgi:wobble nucleotide-excising tRNase
MITKINRIKKFGIYQDYSSKSDLKSFNQYNLFYGWNGSGKSTLANLLACIERKKQSDSHNDSEWEITTDNGSITNTTVQQNELNIRVFNKDFVERNVFTTDDKVKSILYISEEKVVEKQQLETVEVNLKTKSKRSKEITIKLNGNPEDKKSKGLIELNDNFLSDAAKTIKANFKVIEIEDNRLLNYNKTKLSEFIESMKTSIKSNSSTLSVEEIKRLSKSIKPQDKNLIDESEIGLYNIDLLKRLNDKVGELKYTSITSKSIDRLVENPIIAEWVYAGLRDIHTETSAVCEFCGQTLPAGKLNELNQHFSDEFEKLKTALSSNIEWIRNNKISNLLPHESKLFDELKDDYLKSVEAYNITVQKINNITQDWSNILEEKLVKPFNIPNKEVVEISQKEIDEYTSAYTNIVKIVRDHNTKLLGIDSIIKQNKQKLELHYVAEQIAKYSYFVKKQKTEDLQKELSDLRNEIEALNKDSKELKASLSNDILGANEFNDMLSKFLGRDDLRLEVITEGGYAIKRNQNEDAKSRSLSEGEKSAIALVYFIAKLKEDGNKIEDTLVVIDDPISSFDSNHLFHANYYIKNECDNAKQLFVLTHNFKFFSMQKEWVKGKIRKEANKKNIELYNLFLIKPQNINNQRSGNIENADNVLIQFDSEYHMLFSEVKEFSENPQLDYISTHTIANISRQLLESFLSFKFGRKKLEKCFDEITGFKDLSKVRKFVNHYSHKMDNGEAINGFNDNVFGEADKIIPRVLELIKHIDEVHYNSMIERLNQN